MLAAIRNLTVASAALIASAGYSDAFELIMVEQVGCHWCARWDAEIAHIYPKTAEGKTAPLRRIDFHQPLPGDLDFGSRVVFTPTFVLVDEGVEIGRLEGYPGEEMFWWMLSQVFAEIEENPES